MRWLERSGRRQRAVGGGTVLVLLGALAGVLVPTASAGPSCTDTYTASVTTGDWSTAANWSTGQVPSSSDVACWGSAQTLTVSIPGATADSVQGSALSIAGGTLALSSSIHDSSVTALTLTGGTLNGGNSTL